MSRGVFRRRPRFVPRQGSPWLGTSAVNPGVTNLKAWWALEEDTTADRLDSHGSYDLTAIGSPAAITGKISNGCDFNGTTQRLDRNGTADSALSLTVTGGTIFGWIKVNTFGNDDRVLGKWESAAHDWRINLTATSIKVSVGDAGTARDLTWSGTLSTGTWYFVFITIDPSGDLTINVNASASPESLDISSYALENDNPELSMGARANQAVPSDIELDEWGIYDSVLTSAHETWLFNSGAGRAYNELDGAGTLFTASIASTAGGAAAAATATHTAPTYTASIASTAGGAASSATATHTAPTYTASIASTAGGAASAATATFAVGTVTATAACTIGGAASAATATHTTPTYTASIASTAGGAAAAATAAFAASIHQATVACTAGGAAAAASATYAPGTFTASIASAAGGAASSATATHTAPTFTASIASTAGGAAAAATATFFVPGSVEPETRLVRGAGVRLKQGASVRLVRRPS